MSAMTLGQFVPWEWPGNKAIITVSSCFIDCSCHQNGTVVLTGDEEHVIFLKDLNLLLVFKDYCLTCKPVHI